MRKRKGVLRVTERNELPDQRFARLAASVLSAKEALLVDGVAALVFNRHRPPHAQMSYGDEWRLIELAEAGFPYRLVDVRPFRAPGGSDYHLYVTLCGVEFWGPVSEADAQRLVANEKAPAAAATA